MARIQRSERSSHWYFPDGKSCHTVTAKTSGLPRATTVTDARKLGLYPSVTNILGMKSKPALDVWKLDMAINAALDTPQIPGESRESFMSRIAVESERISTEAAEWGTLIHEQLEQYVTGGAFMGTGEILAYVEDYPRWHRENVEELYDAERSVVGAGYAGRLDIFAKVGNLPTIIDFKSQKIKGKAKGVFYNEWAMQLAAYGEAMNLPQRPRLISIIIPSDIPGPVQVHEWDNYDEALAAFNACKELWSFEKGYRP